ncbi:MULTISPECIES: thermonuclease family protein [unclassified Roseivivax]|uniref:thermonuclease family protein n=1 Tax=Roseivivax sp. GX 12232 TaxID=2900547 RepID=UPI001E4F4916|nr:hypothetical protein [Roseivivax sp. GX 12232]MCE0506990.1 hypothetical protein [Roseivivax sp. GX 12232]
MRDQVSRRRRRKLALSFLPLCFCGVVAYGVSLWDTDLAQASNQAASFVAPGPGAELIGRVSHVRDGDTIEVGGVPIRLSDVDCAELGTREGEAARREMDRITRGRVLVCALEGRMSYDRHIARCERDDGLALREAIREKGYCAL